MPPKRLTLGQVPAYVKEAWGIRISRRTANNWCEIGIRTETLHTITVRGTARHPKIKTTTDVWVNEFLTRCGRLREGQMELLTLEESGETLPITKLIRGLRTRLPDGVIWDRRGNTRLIPQWVWRPLLAAHEECKQAVEIGAMQAIPPEVLFIRWDQTEFLTEMYLRGET